MNDMKWDCDQESWLPPHSWLPQTLMLAQLAWKWGKSLWLSHLTTALLWICWFQIMMMSSTIITCSMSIAQYAHLIIIIISSYYHHHHNKLISSSSLDDLQEHQLASCWLSGPTQTRFGQSAGSSPRGQFVWKVVESWSNLVRHPIQVGKLGKCSHL